MNYKVFNIALPIKANNVLIVDGLAQYNTANIVNVRLMDGTEPFDFTGYTEVFLDILKPDGTYISACVTNDPEHNGNNPYTIQVLDPEEGLISFSLQGQATVLTGSHFAEVTVMGAGASVTAARINYYVGDTISRDTDPEGLTSSDDYVSLRTLIAKNSAIVTEEENRNLAEALRMQSEDEREERAKLLEEDIRNYLANADKYVDDCRAFMIAAEQYAQLAQNPSATILAELLEEMNFASVTYVNDEITNATNGFNAGTFTALAKLLNIRSGLDEELPELAEGEPGWSTDTKTLYVGSADGPVPINSTFVISSQEPARDDVLWIDTSAGGSIKYHDGESWRPTATATFARGRDVWQRYYQVKNLHMADHIVSIP